MTPLSHVSTTFTEPVITPWMPGPVDPDGSPVVVSVTEYSSHRRRDLPGVAYWGIRLREGWYAMPGAIGLWLWSLPAVGRGGSISVWSNSEALEQFIVLPKHLRIMDRYRERGSVRSTTWEADRFDPGATLRRAYDWIGQRAG